jgi:T-complex protein 1 subunit epsilon
LIQEQEKKSRVKGIDAVKSNIQAAKAVSRVLRTSLGPKGMDKLLQSPDGDIVISKFLFYYLRIFRGITGI